MEQLRAQLEVRRPRCPFCHEDVQPEDTKVACEACMAWHHAECFQEGGRSCSACGETGTALERAPRPRRPRARPRRPLAADAEAEEEEPSDLQQLQRRFQRPESQFKVAALLSTVFLLIAGVAVQQLSSSRSLLLAVLLAGALALIAGMVYVQTRDLPTGERLRRRRYLKKGKRRESAPEAKQGAPEKGAPEQGAPEFDEDADVPNEGP